MLREGSDWIWGDGHERSIVSVLHFTIMPERRSNRRGDLTFGVTPSLKYQYRGLGSCHGPGTVRTFTNNLLIYLGDRIFYR